VGADLAGRLRDLTLEIYSRAARYAETKGVIIADTKFEFGFIGGELALCDEALTPDSSRFWPLRPMRREARNLRSISSTCAITWNPSAGTSSRPRPPYRMRWPRAPAKNIAKRTAC